MRFPSGRWPLYGAFAVAGSIAAFLVAKVLHDPLFHARAALAAVASPAPEPAPEASGALAPPAAKLEAMHLKVEPARRETLPVEVAAAGRIEATDQHVTLGPRVPGVVRSVAVTLGQQVKAGQLLATLDSPEVGTARLNVRAKLRELTIVQADARWKDTIAANVGEVVKLLRQNKEAADIERQFAGKPLGSRRAELMSTYADLEIAAHEANQKNDLRKRDLIGEHPVALAQHTYEGARARFGAMLEQVSYDAAQQKRLADEQVQLAEAAVLEANQRLSILGIHEDPPAPDAPPVAAEDLVACPMVAPWAGTITTRTVVAGQRVEPVDKLFTLVDLSTVRAVASLPESDYAALPDLTGASLRMTVASYPGRTFRAKVIYVAPEVDPTTRTVRLTAELANPDGNLKPGMFARVVLDSRKSEPALTVPSAAVVDVDGKPGVFVPGLATGTFTFRPITPGREVDGRRVVAEGLKEGDRVVTAGAFELKSEMVLQAMGDEE